MLVRIPRLVLGLCLVLTACLIALPLSAQQEERDALTMTAALFKTQGQLNAVLKDFDFDAHCRINGFEVVYVPQRADAMSIVNQSSYFSAATRRLVEQAKPGDYFIFENIKAWCPGDSAGRPIPAISVRIK